MSFFSIASTSKNAVSLGVFLKKNWYIIILILVILPSIVNAINIAIKDKNPSYPAFVLFSSLISADQVLEHDIILLEENPTLLVGMEKPEIGIWFRVQYYWLYFWNVIYKIVGNVWMIFFPFWVIRKLTDKKNTSAKYKTFAFAVGIFFLTMFVVNVIILTHGLIMGNVLVKMPQNVNTFMGYWILLIELIPFHGVFRAIMFVINSAVAAGAACLLLSPKKTLLHNFENKRINRI